MGRPVITMLAHLSEDLGGHVSVSVPGVNGPSVDEELGYIMWV